ncbi:MAG: RNA polymerase sigma factor [Gemmatimonadota bacterium]
MSEISDIGDAALVERTRTGDESAFGLLIRRHYRVSFAVALGLLGERADAEDVCQDAFIKALEKIDECRNPDRFVGWLLRIVRNRAHNYRTYEKVRKAASLERTDLAGLEDPGRDLETSDLGRRLADAVATLRDVPRQVVLLHDMEGWKHREIAQLLGISEGMSRQHLFVARKKLRALLAGPGLMQTGDQQPGDKPLRPRAAEANGD